MLSVCETSLFNIKNKLLKANRTNAELKSKLDELFETNNAEFKKFQSMYSDERSVYVTTFYDRFNYEDRMIEKYKKLKYGENYAQTND